MNTYILNEMEFMTLAASKGMQRVYGFVMKDQEQADDNEIYQTMYHMVQMGYMKAVDDGFVLLPEFNVMFQVIKDAGRVLWIRENAGNVSDRCCYLGGEHCVVTQLSSRDAKALKVSLIDTEHFEQYLCEEGSFLDSCVTEVIIEEPCIEKTMEEFDEPLEGLQVVYELTDTRNGQTIGSVWIQNLELEDRIMAKSDVIRIWSYSKQKTIEEVMKLMGV